MQSNTSWKESRKGWRTWLTATWWPSSWLSEVTPFPSSPQGTMCSNQVRSVQQFSASPCDVMWFLQCTPAGAKSSQPSAPSHRWSFPGAWARGELQGPKPRLQGPRKR